MNKLLILGSVVSPCPPEKQGGTERVAYYQAKHLSKHGIPLIFVGSVGTKEQFSRQLLAEQEEKWPEILAAIEFVEIGGGTGQGTQEDAISIDPSQTESSRKFRLEMTYLARVQQLMIDRKDDYEAILNNLRGEAILIPLASHLNKPFVNVMHLGLFQELADLFTAYKTPLISISNSQRTEFPSAKYIATIYNPVNTRVFSFNETPDHYALMMGTIGRHKNQADAIRACKKAGIPLHISGKIRDVDYFEQEIKPHIDGIQVIYTGELEFEKKLEMYRNASVFVFPISWQEPFGLVMIEALSCGTPVIAYPHGGPTEIVKDGVNGYLVNNPDEMAEKIRTIATSIKRSDCRKDVEERFSDDVIGEQYVETVRQFLL